MPKATAYVHDVQIEIGGFAYNVLVAFSHAISKHGYGILGQKGFFKFCKVIFDYSKEVIQIKEKK